MQIASATFSIFVSAKGVQNVDFDGDDGYDYGYEYDLDDSGLCDDNVRNDDVSVDSGMIFDNFVDN